MANIILTGDTSGAITVAAPAVAGTNTITLPASTGTIVTDTGSGITSTQLADSAVTAPKLNAGGSGTSGQVLESNGDGSMSWATAAAGGGDYAMEVFSSPGTWTKPASVTAVKVTVIGGGGGAKFSSYANGGTGGTSSFGAYCSATGGLGGQYTYGIYGGLGSGGTINARGAASVANGVNNGGDGAFGLGTGASHGGPAYYSTKIAGSGYGGGSSCHWVPGSCAGGGGGGAIEYLDAPAIPAPVAVTIGGVGASPVPGPFVGYAPVAAVAGTGGVVIVEYWS